MPTNASGPRPNIVQNAGLTSTTLPPIAMIMIPAAAWLKTAPKRESSAGVVRRQVPHAVRT